MKIRSGLAVYLLICLLATSIPFFVPTDALAALADTDGDGYLEIHDIYELQAIKNLPVSDYELAGHIDASDTVNWNDGAGFEPISLAGNFNGNGYSISNLYINRYDYPIGLFAQVSPLDTQSITIEHVHLTDIDMTGGGGALISSALASADAGGIIANVIVQNCSASGNIYGGGGGLIGYAYGADIVNCHSSCDIDASGSPLGGLVGNITLGKITNCYATGEVLLTGDEGNPSVGGLVGLDNESDIEGSYATGAVNVTVPGNEGSPRVGGLLGLSGDINISGCYASGAVSVVGDSEHAYIGGLVGGSGSNTEIRDCAATGNVSIAGNLNNGGIGGFAGSTGNISNSEATGNVFIEGNLEAYIGGLAGYAGDIFDCEAGGGVFITGDVDDGRIGGLAGSAYDISNCKATGDVSITGSLNRGYIGGLLGYSSGEFFTGGISNSTATGEVSIEGDFDGYIGGLTGMSYGVIYGCSASSDIIVAGGMSINAGGLAGGANSVSNSYAYGNVSASASEGVYAGGLTGGGGLISSSYAHGSVSAQSLAQGSEEYVSYVGGLAGSAGSIEYSQAGGPVTDLSTGNVSICAGGLAGMADEITICSASGLVTCNGDAITAGDARIGDLVACGGSVPPEPTVVGPTDGQQILAGDYITLVIASYYDCIGGVEWQVLESSEQPSEGDWVNAKRYYTYRLQYSEGETLLYLDLPAEDIKPGETYYYHAKIKSCNGVWSEWSDLGYFETLKKVVLLVHGFQYVPGWHSLDNWRKLTAEVTGADFCPGSPSLTACIGGEDPDDEYHISKWQDGEVVGPYQSEDGSYIAYLSNYSEPPECDNEDYLCQLIRKFHCTFGNIHYYGRNLKRDIDAILAKEEVKVDQIDIVAHSMGGLVSRAYIESGDFGASEYIGNVDKLIMIATPNHGAAVALAGNLLIQIAKEVRYIALPAHVLDLYIPSDSSVKQMDPTSGFIRTLNEFPWYLGGGPGDTHGVDYYTIAGISNSTFEGDGLILEREVKLDGVPHTVITEGDYRGHDDLLRNNATVHEYVHDTLDGHWESVPYEDPVPAFAFIASGTVTASETVSYDITISDAQSVAFNLYSLMNRVNITLTTPNGVVVDPIAAANDPEVTYSESDGSPSVMGYIVLNPEPGIWTANLDAANAPDEGDVYAVAAIMQTETVLSVSTDKYDYIPGESINISAELTNETEPLSNISVIANIVTPEGITDEVILYDDGLHNDGIEGDGTYANSYSNTSSQGNYEINVCASGLVNEEPFVRLAFTSAWIELYPDPSIDASTISFSNDNPNGGDAITISAIVNNLGDADAEQAIISFWDDSPPEGSQIGEAVITVPVGSGTEAAVSWTAIPGDHDIRVSVSPFNSFTDSDYSNNAAFKSIHVNGPTILADAGGPYIADEGSLIVLDASNSSYATGNPLEYRWDFDCDGDQDTRWSNNPIAYFGPNEDWIGNSTVLVRSGSLTAKAIASIMVNNVAPIADAGEDQTVIEGDVVTFSGWFYDPGKEDTHTATIDWGDGTVEPGPIEIDAGDEAVIGDEIPTVAGTHIYAQPGVYTITLTVTDDDGGIGTGIATITVNSIPPIVDAGDDQISNEGETVNVTGTFTDPDLEETHTAIIDWGDGTQTTETVVESAGTGTVDGSHVYADNGVYIVTLTVSDRNGGVGEDVLDITVNNLPPTVEITALADPPAVNVLTDMNATFVDQGELDTHTAIWDWGDGIISFGMVDESSGSGTVIGSHVYTSSGEYTVTLTVTDDDDGSGINSAIITGSAPEIWVQPQAIDIALEQGETIVETLLIGNNGDETLTFEIGDTSSGLVDDPQEGGAVDIERISATIGPTDVDFKIDTYSILQQEIAYIWLDTDQNLATGITDGLYPGYGLNDIGADYAIGIDLTTTTASLIDCSTFAPVSTLVLNISGNSLDLSVSLSDMADDGNIDLTAILMDMSSGATDIAPDVGHATFSGTVEEEWLSLSPTSGTVAPGDQIPIEIAIDTTGLDIGEYSTDIVIDSDDPDNSEVLVPVTLTVTETTTDCITFNFVDQYGDLVGTGDERVYVDGYGYMADGDQITVDPGATVNYRAYYKQGSGLYGPKMSHVYNSGTTLDVMFHTLTMDFEDQHGDLDPASGIGTGDERAYMDYVGYKADGENATIPLNSTIQHRAYYKEGSGLYSPKVATDVNGSASELTVMFHMLTMDLEDQNGDLDPASGIGTGEERAYIDYVGYKADGETVTIPLNSATQHRAYFKQGSGLYGPKAATDIDGSADELTVQFHTLTVDLEDQNGDLDSASGIGTGEERAYLDHVGYKADGENATVPLNSTTQHRAYFKQGSGLYSPKVATAIDGSSNELAVMFHTLTMDLEDQNGDLEPASGIGTGEERAYIDYVGYKAHGENATIPLNSTIQHRTYFKEGSGLYSPKVATDVNSSASELTVMFHTLTMDLEDQNGDLDPASGIGTGEERAYIDHVGYKADGETATVPLNSATQHRAYFKQGSGLYSPKVATAVDGSSNELTVMFHTLTMDFEDQNGDIDPASSIGTGDERAYIDHVGYVSGTQTATIPFESTIQHRAYYREGSGLYGPKLERHIAGGDDDLIVEFRGVSFEVLDSVTHNPVIGAQVYVDHVGYVDNEGTITVPNGSTIQHKANMNSTWSVEDGKEIDESWDGCIYEWDGVVFGASTYW